MYHLALRIATKAHKDQYRWDKKTPYITHPIAVSTTVDAVEAKVVALLHDVVEDTDISLEDLGTYFSHHIIMYVDALTKRAGEEYVTYLNRVAEHYVSTEVKIADIRHNLSQGLKKGSMRDKYLLAIEYLLLQRSMISEEEAEKLSKI